MQIGCIQYTVHLIFMHIHVNFIQWISKFHAICTQIRFMFVCFCACTHIPLLALLVYTLTRYFSKFRWITSGFSLSFICTFKGGMWRLEEWMWEWIKRADLNGVFVGNRKGARDIERESLLYSNFLARHHYLLFILFKLKSQKT